MDVNALLAQHPQILPLPTFYLETSQGLGGSIRLATT